MKKTRIKKLELSTLTLVRAGHALINPIATIIVVSKECN